MDLSFTRFEGTPVRALPGDLAVLLVGVAARQAVSPTARLHAALLAGTAGRAWFAPCSGAFNTDVAVALATVAEQVKPAFTEPVESPSKSARYRGMEARGGPPPRSEVAE